MPNLFMALRLLRPSHSHTALDVSRTPFALYHQWVAFAGLLLFAAYLLWLYDVWVTLARADPTGITLMIIVVFVCSTAWCGLRAYGLCQERADFDDWKKSAAVLETPFLTRHVDAGAVHDFLSMLDKLPSNAAAPHYLGDILAERLHGPSESAWWVNGIQIKLGLLGKVIGFSILALQIARIENFDPAQSQTLLKNLTGGLGIALLATAVGLVANMLLGLQLVRLDRYADTLLGDTLKLGEDRLRNDAVKVH